jgi:ubiquinone/menaquinone biosynthesis C-methylase UbiE
LALTGLEAAKSGFIDLVDMDASALDFSRQKLLELTPHISFSFINDDVLRAMRRLARVERGTYDAVIFGGLFDYLPDRLIVLSLRNAQRLLNPEGEILFSQVSHDNPNRTFMKWYGDWILNERDETALRSLCQEAGFPSDVVRFSREKTGTAILVLLNGYRNVTLR